MALNLRLSPLPDVAAFLVQRAQGYEELQAALDDGLQDYTQGAEVVMDTLRALLDKWLEEGQQVLQEANQFTNPFQFLAITDHIQVVQAFRDLL